MVTVVVPAHVYRRMIDRWATPLERAIFADLGKHLPDGKISFLLDDDLANAIRGRMLSGESLAAALERLCASQH